MELGGSATLGQVGRAARTHPKQRGSHSLHNALIEMEKNRSVAPLCPACDASSPSQSSMLCLKAIILQKQIRCRLPCKKCLMCWKNTGWKRKPTRCNGSTK